MASGTEPLLLIVILLGILSVISVVAVLVGIGMFAAQITANAKPPHPHVKRH